MLAAILATLPLLSGHSGTEILTFATGQAPHVTMQTSVGSIAVKAGGSGVDVVATKKASSVAGLANLQVLVEGGGDDITLKAIYKNGCSLRCDGGVSFVVRVPVGTVLDLQTSVGNISAEDLRGNLRMESSTGALSAVYGNALTVRSIRMTTTIGRVTLSLPLDARLGRVLMKTMVGRVNSDWPVEASSAFVVNASVDKTFAPAGIDIYLSTATGAIYLTKNRG